MSSRVALVTGGTRGIGAAIAVALHRNGFRVAAVYAARQDSADRFREATGIPVFQADVSDFHQSQECVQHVTRELDPVDVLVNNAGIIDDVVLHRATPEQWGRVLQTNLSSCFNMCRAVVPAMRERRFGRIINIGSINGQTGQVGQTAYAAAKAGMHGLTMALAREGAPKGITVNLVAPGYIETDMMRAVREDILADIVSRIPVGRLGQPEEIARAVLFLASDEASFITGSTLSINGGQHIG